MDDEDLGKQVIGENLMATAAFEQNLKQKDAQLQHLTGGDGSNLLNK